MVFLKFTDGDGFGIGDFDFQIDGNLDHILVTPTVEVERAEVLDYPLSDHLPISMEVVLPESVELHQ